MGTRYRNVAVSLATFTALLFLMAACSPDEPATVNVIVENFKYVPDPVTVRIGDSITWTNEDPVGHTATATDDSFDTGMFFPDNSATITFDTAGTFPYFCGVHPEMIGMVIVDAD